MQCNHKEKCKHFLITQQCAIGGPCVIMHSSHGSTFCQLGWLIEIATNHKTHIENRNKSVWLCLWQSCIWDTHGVLGRGQYASMPRCGEWEIKKGFLTRMDQSILEDWTFCRNLIKDLPKHSHVWLSKTLLKLAVTAHQLCCQKSWYFLTCHCCLAETKEDAIYVINCPRSIFASFKRKLIV